MKMIFFSVFILLSNYVFPNERNELKVVFQGKNFAKERQDTLAPFLASLDLNYFISKPVDSFLVAVPSNYLSMQILPGDQLKKASSLVVRYSGNICLAIFVKNFIHMNPNPPSSSWSVTLFRRELINRIEIYNGTLCINGCQ